MFDFVFFFLPPGDIHVSFYISLCGNIVLPKTKTLLPQIPIDIHHSYSEYHNIIFPWLVNTGVVLAYFSNNNGAFHPMVSHKSLALLHFLPHL